MSAPVIIDFLMDAILRKSTVQDDKQAVEQNGSEIRERMNEKLGASDKRGDCEVSRDNVTDENLNMIVVPPENISDGKTSRKRKRRAKRVEEKDIVIAESQSMVPLIMEEGSTNPAEGNAAEKRKKKRKRKAKVNDEVQILGQNNMETGSKGKEIVTTGKPRFKDDVRMGLTRMDGERSRENLAEGDVTIEKPKSRDEGQTADQTRVGAGSTVNLPEGNVTLKNKRIQEEVQSMDECTMVMGSTEKNSDRNVTGKRKKKHKRKAKNKDEVQGEIDTRSGEMNVRSTHNLVEGDVTFEKPKSKDGVKTIGQFTNESGSGENSVEGDVNVMKPIIKDEVQNLDQITMVSGSTAEGNVTIRDAKTQDEVQSMDQTNMDTRPSENVADGQGTKNKKKKRKNKANIKDEVQREQDTRSREDLGEENATVQNPKIRDGILGIRQTKMDTGSSENLTEGNLTIKDKKVQEVESMDQTIMDSGGRTENFTEGNESGKRKKKRRSKVQISDEVQSNIDTRSAENPAQGNATMEKPKTKDDVQSIGQSQMGTCSAGNLTIKDQKVLCEVQSMAQTKMDTGPTENSAEGNVIGKRKKKRNSKAKDNNDVHSNIDTRSTENLAHGNEIIEMPKIKDNVQSVGQTKFDTGSTENIALGGNVTAKNPNIQDEDQDINHSKMDTRPSENSAEGAATGERKKKRKSKVKFDDDVQRQRDTSLTENISLGNATIKMLQIKDEVHSIDQTKMDTGSTGSTAERNVSIQDETQSMDQIKMDMGPSENFADANVIGKGKRKPKSKVKIKDEIQREQDTRLKENLGQGNVSIEKPKIKDDVQTPMSPGSIENLAERNVSFTNLKTQDEAQRMDQITMDTRESKSFAEGNVTGKIKKKRKSKAKINDEVRREMNTRSTKNLAQGNAIIEKPKIKEEFLTVSQTKTNLGSIEILAERNSSIKNPEMQVEAQRMDQINMDKGPSENFADGNVTGKTKRKPKSKADVKYEALSDIHTGPIESFAKRNMTIEKPKIEDEVQSGGRTKLDTGSSVNPAEGNVTIKNSKIQDEAHSMHQTKMDIAPKEDSAEGNVTAKRKKRRKKAKTEDEIRCEMDTRLTENLAEGNASIKKPEIEPDVQSLGLSKMDTGSTENFPEGNATLKKPEIDDEFQSVGLTNMDTGSTEIFAEGHVTIKNPKITEVKNVEKTEVDKGPTGDITERNVSGGRKSRKSRRKKAKSENEFSSAYRGGSTSNLNCELHIDGKLGGDCINKSGALPRPMELESKLVPSESLHICHPQHFAEQKEKSENGSRLLSEVSHEILLDKGKYYADGTSAISTCEDRVTTKDVCPQTAPNTSIRRKLLVLDVNGLLADIIYQGANQSSGGFRMLGRTVYKRPFCDDFLKFCFQNFDVGIWSSRSKKIIDKVVSYLLGDQRDKLLFCWDMDHSTQTGLNTLENKHKPLVCKELRKVWENAYPNLPWKKGDYDESNTLLLDDSPYKALLNPLNTAIFPEPYQYDNKNDDSLGPGGALRVYLEGLLTSDNVQKYVESHPLGQRPITEENSSWEYYSRVLQEKTSISNSLEDKTPTSDSPLEDKTAALDPPLEDKTAALDPPLEDKTAVSDSPLEDKTPKSDSPLGDNIPTPIHALS